MKENDSKHINSIFDEEATVNQIKDGLEKLDEWNEVATPNLQWFQQQVEVEKKRLRKKLWRDLFAFIVVAVILLSVVITVVYRQPILFLYFQLVGIILLPLAFKKSRRKVSNE